MWQCSATSGSSNCYQSLHELKIVTINQQLTIVANEKDFFHGATINWQMAKAAA